MLTAITPETDDKFSVTWVETGLDRKQWMSRSSMSSGFQQGLSPRNNGRFSKGEASSLEPSGPLTTAYLRQYMSDIRQGAPSQLAVLKLFSIPTTPPVVWLHSKEALWHPTNRGLREGKKSVAAEEGASSCSIYNMFQFCTRDFIDGLGWSRGTWASLYMK